MARQHDDDPQPISESAYFALSIEGKAAVPRDAMGRPFGYWDWSKDGWTKYYQENPREPNAGPVERERPAYYSEEEWAEYLRSVDARPKPKRGRQKAGVPAKPNGNGAAHADLGFICAAEGQVVRFHPQNIRIALQGLGAVVRQNDFTGAPQIFGIDGLMGELTDAAATRIRFLIGETYCFLPPKELFEDVLIDVAHQNRFHPVREWLDALQWDGRPRIDDWLVAYGGAENTPFNRAVGRAFLLAGVRRVRRPGCKFDTMLVLEGPQGRNKSQAAEALAMQRGWFTDGLSLDADPKMVIEQTQGAWILEFAELTGMRTRELERIKAFLSRNVDKARAAYGRRAQAVPRQFVGIGTTNDREYLRKDERRLWPVLIRRFDLEGLRRDVPQLWAEAAYYEAEGEEIVLQEDLWGAATEARVERIIADPIEEVLAESFGDKPGWVSTKSIWAILNVPVDRRSAMATAVGNAMGELGFTIRQVGSRGEDDPRGKRGTRYYERGETEAERERQLYF